MKLETILDALEEAKHESNWYYSIINAPGYEEENKRKYERRARQYRAFRDRLIRIDERNKMRIAFLEAELGDLQDEFPYIVGTGVHDEA